MLIEQLLAHGGVEQLHTALEIGGNTVDNGYVILHLVVHNIELVQLLLQDILFKVVRAVSISVIHKRNKQILFDIVDIEVASLLAGIACNGIAHIGYTVVFVRGNNNLTRIGIVCVMGEDGNIRALFDMEFFHLLEIDITGDIGICNDNVLLVIAHHKAAQRVKSFNFTLIDLVRAVEDEGRKNGYTAVFSIEVPVAPHTDMVHKRVIVIARDDTYSSDIGADQI